MDEFFEDVSIPSPTAPVLTPITIAPCPSISLGISQVQTPIFNDSTATTTTSNVDPPVSVNGSDAGAGASGFTVSYYTLPISTIRQGQLKSIKKKLDSLLESTKASYSDSYSQEAVKALIKTTLKEHATNLEKENKAVEYSAVTCKEATKKVDKLISDARSFMRTFQSSNEINTTKVNAVISNLSSSLKTEMEALTHVRTGLQHDNNEFQNTISSKIDKLHNELAMENKIVDQLAAKTGKVKVLTIQINHADKEITELNSKIADMKSCIADVNSLLSNIIETRDPLIPITVKKHLAEKPWPAFTILNRLEGVSESTVLP
ncbi:unnamed protein product [Lactuca saligna]|uniref:Uncharacterized protein n=1 Tax=Lactuca saligna TaxID=75948 RepID=A0AA36EL27_LACSI|nr:unnamed protein product [Lactuca saligna]